MSIGRKLWGIGRFGGDCAGSPWKSLSGTTDQKDDISVSCSEMMLQLLDVYDTNKVETGKLYILILTCSASATNLKTLLLNR